MEKTTLLLVAPQKLKGLKADIESITGYCDKQVFLQVVKEYTQLKDFLEYTPETDKENPDYVLVFESITEIRVNTEKAQEELLGKLKEIKLVHSRTKIIIILQKEKETELLFINELMKLDIQDFHFTEKFSKDKIALWIFSEPKAFKDNLKYLSINIQKPEKEIVTKEITKYITIPETENSKKSQEPNLKKPQSHARGKVVNIIGVFGAGIGVGTTSTCVEIAKRYLADGYKTAIIEANESKQLCKIKIKNVDIHAGNMLGKIDFNNYDYIFFDFGCFAEIDSEGEYLKSKIENTIDRNIFMKFCRSIILVCSGKPWRLYEAEFFIKNEALSEETKDWIFLINETEKTSELIQFIKLYDSIRFIASKTNKDFLEILETEIA